MGPVDVVVVSYNSRAHLRACVESVASVDNVNVTVVDNDSTDGCIETLAGLPVEVVRMGENGGFARGSNAGWRRGSAPQVLLLNPDATIAADSLERLVAVLESDRQVAAVAPRIVHDDGTLAYSLRRFPRVVPTYAQALFLHRLFPRAAWADDLVRDPEAYRRPGSPEWVSGACVLLRRAALEKIGGLDEGFFLYAEDIDLCRRLRTAGWDVRYEPAAVCVHVGGASAPSNSLLPVLARSRIRYAKKHLSPFQALLMRGGIGLGALTHMVVAQGGLAARAAHARSLGSVVSRVSVGSGP
jgi:GT2 family glycosyltransferase